jgi:predicted flap endonuclease-1-like 5' DNA nuclease
MFYLISQFFWWLLVAVIFGLIVGWVTSDRNPDRRLGWLWLALVVAVIAFALTWLRAVNGVPALWTETALLFFGTYLGGCWIGGLLKTVFNGEELAMGGVRDWQSNLGAPGPGLGGVTEPGGVRGWNADLGQAGFMKVAPAPGADEAAPSPAAAPLAAITSAGDDRPVWAAPREAPPVDGVPNWLLNLGEPGPGLGGGASGTAAWRLTSGVPDWTRDLGQAAPEAAVAASAPSAADPPLMPAVEGESAIAGQRPVGFVSPRDGKVDDLKLIRGIGRQNEGRLHALGIWHFAQIAGWSRQNIDWVGSYLAFPGRIDREDWVGQAAILASGKATEFSTRVKKGLVETSRDEGSTG